MKICFSVKCQDEDFIKQIKKRATHDLKLSNIVVEALKLWFKDPSKKALLPAWQEFKTTILEMSDNDFKETKEKVNHFQCIVKATEQYRNGVVEDES